MLIPLEKTSTFCDFYEFIFPFAKENQEKTNDQRR